MQRNAGSFALDVRNRVLQTPGAIARAPNLYALIALDALCAAIRMSPMTAPVTTASDSGHTCSSPGNTQDLDKARPLKELTLCRLQNDMLKPCFYNDEPEIFWKALRQLPILEDLNLSGMRKSSNDPAAPKRNTAIAERLSSLRHIFVKPCSQQAGSARASRCCGRDSVEGRCDQCEDRASNSQNDKTPLLLGVLRRPDFSTMSSIL